MKIPPIGSECRQAVIRDAHQQISALGSPSFRNTALRLGLKEAEVIYAHSEVCRGITAINVADSTLWDLVNRKTATRWIVQLGESNNWLKINDSIYRIALENNILTLSGHNWKTIISDIDTCHAFVIGCGRPNSRFRITIYDAHGTAQAVIMPQEGFEQSNIKNEILNHISRNPCAIPTTLEFEDRITESAFPSVNKSFTAFIEQCRERELQIYFAREGQFKSIITGHFLSHEQNGREFYYNIGGHDILIDYDSVHSLNYVNRGACMAAQGNNGTRHVIGLVGTANAEQVLSWMELIEQYKVAS